LSLLRFLRLAHFSLSTRSPVLDRRSVLPGGLFALLGASASFSARLNLPADFASRLVPFRRPARSASLDACFFFGFFFFFFLGLARTFFGPQAPARPFFSAHPPRLCPLERVPESIQLAVTSLRFSPFHLVLSDFPRCRFRARIASCLSIVRVSHVLLFFSSQGKPRTVHFSLPLVPSSLWLWLLSGFETESVFLSPTPIRPDFQEFGAGPYGMAPLELDRLSGLPLHLPSPYPFLL